MRHLCLSAFLSLICSAFSFAQNYQSTIGSFGTGNNQYNDPVQSAVAANGDIYVLDRSNSRVQVLDGNGNFVFQFGSAGGGPGQFQSPEGIAISPNNFVYVVDAGHYKVQAFDLSGVWQFEFGSQGAGNGLFLSPVGVAVNSSGEVYVTESNRVQKFDQYGNFISIVGTNNTGSNAYDSPRFLEVDRTTDNVYVTDWYGEVLVYNSAGTLVNAVNVGGQTLDVAISSSYVYVVRNDNTIHKYTLGLSFVTSFGGSGGGNGSFSQLNSIEIENNFERLYLTDVGFDNIQIFNDVVEPSTQASALVFSNVTANSLDVSWNAGDGTSRMVIASTLGNPPVPADFQVYNANASWGSGDIVAGVAYVLYAGNGNTMTVTNLTASTTYYFHVFEFNGTTSPNYNQLTAFDNPLTISTVANGPSIQATSISFSNITTSSIDVSWLNGDGSRRIVVASNVGLSGLPANNTTYTANSFYGNGSQINPGEYVVYDGNGNSVSVGGLNPNTIYDFQIFEYNGNPGSEVYLTSTAPGNPNSETTSAMCVANAGGNNSVNSCNDSPLDLFSSLSGTPDPGGTWTQISGPGSPVITGDQVDLLGQPGGSYDFEYRVTEASCPDVTSVVTVNVTEQANAGINNTVSACNTDSAFDLIGNLGGTPDTAGTWAQISGPVGVTTIGHTANLVGAASGTYVFEYTIIGITCMTVSAQLTVTVDEFPSLFAGSNAELCETSGSTLLNGTAANYSTVSWTTNGTGTFDNPNVVTPSYTFGPGENGTITFTLQAFGLGVCSNASGNFDLTITPAPFVNAGTNNTICEGGNWNIVDATASNYANITWSTSGTGTFSDPNALTTTYNPGIGDIGLTTLTLNVNANGSCSATSGVKFLTINEAGFVANPGNQVICEGANTSAVIFTGTATSFSWTNDNPSIGLAASGTGNISSFTTISSGSATITVTADNSGCTGPPEIFSINVNSNGSVANPGNQTLCQGQNTSSITFTGTATSYNWTNDNPSIGLAGSGSGDISTFTTTGSGVATITVTPINGGCAGTPQIFTITVSQTPTIATAGTDQNICSTGTVLSANSPSVGFGTWSIVSGVGGNIANSPDPTSPFTGVQGNTYVLRWTTTNGSCTASFDEVTITFNQIPTTANAGADITQCNNSAFTLAGNTPLSGAGIWTVVSGTATITAPASSTSGITGVPPGTSAILRWTISNGACSSSIDDVILTNENAPTTANAGGDQNICGTATVLSGNSPSVGFGTWSIVSGAGGNIANSPDPTSPFSGLQGNIYVLRWTITNGSCTASFDDVTIDFNAVPTTANAGTDQNQCNTANFTLAGNIPVTGTGTWSLISGTGTVTTPASPTSTITGIPAGTSATLRWTITNGSCTASTDDVIVTNQSSPTIANAGTDITQCNSGNFTLAGNTPVAGTGTWSVITGSATITTPNAPTSTVTVLAAGTSATLRWTISNGVCTASIDDVILTNSATPTTASAGVDKDQCNNGNFTLAANMPTTGTGTWSLISGTGTVTTPASPTSTVTGIPAGTSATLRWTITNGSCTASTDDVIVTNSATPTTATAGLDQDQCNNGNFTLTGNSAVMGSGLWSVVAGTATITSATSPTSTVTGIPVGSSAMLRWTISSGACTASFDDVLLVNNIGPTTANAGTDISQCNDGNFTLAGNMPSIGAGTWSLISGTATITTPGSPTSAVTGIPIGSSATVRWTITDGSCTASADDVVITNNATPLVTNPGGQTVCEGSNTTLITFSGSATVYNWINDDPSIGLAASGNGNIGAFTTTASGTSTITVIPDNSGCMGTPEIFTITVNPTGTVNNPGNQTVCQSGNTAAVVFSGTATTYNWINDNPSIGLAASGSGNIAAFPTAASGSATITVTPDNSGCPGASEIFTITVNPVGTVTNPGDQTLCQYSNTSPISFTGTATSFNWTNNDPSIGLATNGIADLPAFTALSPGIATITVTPDNAGCTGVAEVFSITVNVMPTVSATNFTVTLNSGGITDIQMVATPGASISFVATSPKDVLGANPGNGNTIAQVLTNITAVDQTVTYEITPSTAFCVGQAITVDVVVLGSSNLPSVITPDSLALVSFFSSTKGQQWINNTNWLSGKVDTWFGVSVANQRVTAISLTANNLHGTLPADMTQLDGLLQLELTANDIAGEIIIPSQLADLLISDNNFTSWNNAPASLANVDVSANALEALPSLNLDTVSVFDVRNNRLVFDDLEPYLSQPSFNYIPQDKAETVFDILVDVGTTQTFTAQVVGDSYQWFINDIPIDTAITNELAISNVQVKDDAVYHYTVTNTAVPGLTLERNDIFMKVSSLKRDSIALRELYLNTAGANWKSAVNWISTPLTTGNWEGVQIQNSRVVALALPDNNITGVVSTLKDIGNLQNVNLSNNHITGLPDLTGLSSIQTLNLSGNDLQFDALEPNAAIAGINYANQRPVGTGSYVQIHSGGFYTIDTDIAGSENVYQWKKSGQNLSGETSSQLQITNIGRANMGEFDCQVTNALVPNLTLTTRADTVYAVANIEGAVFESTSTLTSDAFVTLLKVTDQGGYDTTATYQVSTGKYTFTDVVLADYQVHAILTDDATNNALPTYYTNTIFWEEASEVQLNNDVSDIDITIQYLTPPVALGTGVIKGFVEEAEDPSGRSAASKRVGNAGVATRRVEDSGRGKETYTLVGYVLTNENGEFEFTHLQEATYKLNIQYPGYPMDESSDVVFDIGSGLNAEVTVTATVEEGQIVVRKIIVTGTWSREDYKMEMYPNPAKHFLNLEFSNEDPTRAVRIFSINGTRIIDEKITGKTAALNLKPLSSGSYFLYVFEGGTVKHSVKLSIE
jgi:hypothetical protein